MHGAPFAINGMNFSTDLEPDIVGCDRFEQIVKLVSMDAKAGLFQWLAELKWIPNERSISRQM